jgi:hypothetical protein
MALLKGIRAEMTGFQNTQYLPHALHRIMQDFYDLNQGKHQSNQVYYDEFNSMVLSATESGATIGSHPGAINEVLNTTVILPILRLQNAMMQPKLPPVVTWPSPSFSGQTKYAMERSTKKLKMNTYATRAAHQPPGHIRHQ